MKSKATGCCSISTVFSSIVLPCVSSIIKITVISTTIFKNITEKLEKNDIFCFHYFGGALTVQGVIYNPWVRKGVKKI